MSEHQLKVIENNSFLGKNKYLIPNLGNKNLQTSIAKLYVNLGLQQKKITEY